MLPCPLCLGLQLLIFLLRPSPHDPQRAIIDITLFHQRRHGCGRLQQRSSVR